MKRSLFACAKAKRRNYLHLNKKLVVGNLIWKCESKAKTNIAKSNTTYIENTKYSIYNTYIPMERYHTYTSEYSITIKCYHCKNEWSVEGITTKYKCTKCGRWGIGKSAL